MAFWSADSSVNFNVTELDGLDLDKDKFVKKMLQHTYEKVLFMPVMAIGGDSKTQAAVFSSASDRYSPKSHGFVYWAAKAMAEKCQIILEKSKISDGSYLLKRAQVSNEEITADNLVMDFTDYEATDLLSAYFGMMYDALSGAAMGVKASQGLIVYLEKLAETLSDSKAKEIIEGQIRALGQAVKGGKTGYASGGSKIEFINFDIEPTTKAIEFCYSQVAGHLGLPMSAINGVGGSAMSDTGESDRKKTRKATEFYFLSIVRPILNSLFMRSDFELETELENLDSLSNVMMLIDGSQSLSDQGKLKLAAQFGLSAEDLNLDQ